MQEEAARHEHIPEFKERLLAGESKREGGIMSWEVRGAVRAWNHHGNDIRKRGRMGANVEIRRKGVWSKDFGVEGFEGKVRNKETAGCVM